MRNETQHETKLYFTFNVESSLIFTLLFESKHLVRFDMIEDHFGNQLHAVGHKPSSLLFLFRFYLKDGVGCSIRDIYEMPLDVGGLEGRGRVLVDRPGQLRDGALRDNHGDRDFKQESFVRLQIIILGLCV